ncbi:MAG: hypothetical protein H0U27_14595 [Nitrosopumilus sp.]|nr:hypothetical protein [Nitrosopumilus sp.]
MSDQQILNLKRMFALSRTPTIINVDKNGVHVQKNGLKMIGNACTEIDNVKAKFNNDTHECFVYHNGNLKFYSSFAGQEKATITVNEQDEFSVKHNL